MFRKLEIFSVDLLLKTKLFILGKVMNAFNPSTQETMNLRLA